MARSTDDFMLTAPSPTTNPFLKWAGGKRQLLSSLRQRYPRGFNKYFEPFLGGGATFFDLCSQERLTDGSATLSDLNGDCIGCYLMVRNRVEDVIDTLTELSVGYRDGAQRHYYLVRDQFNASRQPLRNRSDPLSAGYTPELSGITADAMGTIYAADVAPAGGYGLAERNELATRAEVRGLSLGPHALRTYVKVN